MNGVASTVEPEDGCAQRAAEPGVCVHVSVRACMCVHRCCAALPSPALGESWSWDCVHACTHAHAGAPCPRFPYPILDFPSNYYGHFFFVNAHRLAKQTRAASLSVNRVKLTFSLAFTYDRVRLITQEQLKHGMPFNLQQFVLHP